MLIWEKKVCAGGNGCSDPCGCHWLLRSKSGIGKRAAIDWWCDRAGTGIAGISGDPGRRDRNAGANGAGAKGIRHRREGRNVDTDGGNAGISSMENSTETAEPMCYQASDQGYTITLTDYYATNQAIFLGVKIESENGFPEMSSSGDGESEIMVATLEEYSFRSGDPVHGGRPIRGQLVDEHTFLGMLRIDYKSIQTGDQGYYEEIPEEMTLQLEIPYFFLYPKGASKETVHGSWKFPELSVSQSDKGVQVIEINETNAAGFGLEKIEVSPVELTVYDISPEDHLVMTVVLDKEGRKLAYAGNNANELITSGYDISEITVYLYDYEEYMEIKGLAFKDLTAFRDTLEKNALYEKKIPLEIDKP